MRKNYLLILSFVLIFTIFSSCFADDASTATLTALLQEKMAEIEQLKSTVQTLEEENQALKLQLAQYEGQSGQIISSVCTNQAEFIDDVTIPDYSEIGLGQSFRKTWRLRNTGTCTWTTGYKVVSIGSYHMGGNRYAFLTESVRPGEMTDISIDLVAPTYSGDYQSEFRLEDERGNRFGIIGTKTGKELSFWLKIRAVDLSKCAVISFSPSTISRNSDFDAVFKIKNNSGEYWDAKGIDVRMTSGKDMLKFDKAYIDLPSSVENGGTLSVAYDMIAPDDGGNYPVTLEFIRGGSVYCTVSDIIAVR